MAGALAHRGNVDLSPVETGAHKLSAAPGRHHTEDQDCACEGRGGGSGTARTGRRGDSMYGDNHSGGSSEGAQTTGDGGGKVGPASAKACKPWQRHAHMPAAHTTWTLAASSPVASGSAAGWPQQPPVEGSSVFREQQQHLPARRSSTGQPQEWTATFGAAECAVLGWIATARTLTGKGKPIAPAMYASSATTASQRLRSAMSQGVIRRAMTVPGEGGRTTECSF
jgi:hypothetical protein